MCAQLQGCCLPGQKSNFFLSFIGLYGLPPPGADTWALCGLSGIQPWAPRPCSEDLQSQLDPLYHFSGLEGS